MKRLIALTLAGAVALSGCSVVMEATRPDPVDLSSLTVGESRMDVIGELGAPTANNVDGQPCDVYKLYTKGPDDVGKAVIATGEAVADVFTWGLAEIVLTPAEAATRNAQHTVVICYDGHQDLVSVKESH